MTTFIYEDDENCFFPEVDLFYRESNINFENSLKENDLIKDNLNKFNLEDEDYKELISILNIMNESIYIDLGKYEDENYLCKCEILSILKKKKCNNKHINKNFQGVKICRLIRNNNKKQNNKNNNNNISSKFQNTQSTLIKTETTITNK
jgi:hypothetical protein